MVAVEWQLDADGGWLGAAQRISSPNCDERPPASRVNLIVVHGISLPSGCFGGDEIIQLFCNQLDCTAQPALAELEGVRVSAHLLLRRDGALVQFVPFYQRAWHAGVSSWQGCDGCNDFAIGIELEGSNGLPYEAVQYRNLARVAQLLMRHYPGITPERIVGHSDIAPGRKTDPGPAFDWEQLQRLIQQ